MRLFVAAIFIFLSLTIKAQIVNIESLRKVTDTSGFSGTASAAFSLKRNVNDFFTISTNVHLQYKMRNHLVLFKNDFDFQKIEGENFENSGLQHIRYNYRFHPFVTWEVFVQGQYNKVSLIDFRGLAGTGPRFKLMGKENYRIYLGTLAMFEYEDVNDGVTPLQRNWRGSAYISFSLYPNDRISLVSTTYYQPLFSDFGDYRLSSESSLLVGLFKNFSLKTTYTFIYDAFPAVGIPNSQYTFSTGISYAFD